MEKETELNIRPCEGPGCKTLVAGVDPFCSPWCRNVAFDVLPQRFPCRCGHVCCGGEEPAPYGCVAEDQMTEQEEKNSPAEPVESAG